MAKEQRRGNRETRKPKAPKPAATAAVTIASGKDATAPMAPLTLRKRRN